jgi:NAD(P)-dependent dehydrogenase (short-subunit alcohol dehydrogenase family)
MIEEEGGEAVVFQADCTKWRDCANMVMAAVETFGTVDILVNNLGLATFGTALDMHERDWDRTLDINLRTVFLASKYAIPVMAAQGSGAIINLSSISGQRGGRTLAYSAAKAGVEAMTFDMALAHGRQGVRVNCILPGNLVTPIASNIMATLPDHEFIEEIRQQASMIGTPGDAWDIANAAVFLASDEARWITAVTLPVDAGSLKMGPQSIVAQIRAVHEKHRKNG